MIGRKLAALTAGTAVLLAAAGCVYIDGMWRGEVMNERAVSIAEALQLPLDAPVYTAFNLWYDAPGELDARNYINGGAYLPAGTEIVPVEASVRKLVFDAEGRRWTLSFDTGRMMVPIEDYIRQVFTLEPWSERTAGLDPDFVRAILDGTVLPGMTRAEVEMCFGPPSPAWTPDRRNATWVYRFSSERSLRVIFRGNKVREVADFLED